MLNFRQIYSRQMEVKRCENKAVLILHLFYVPEGRGALHDHLTGSNFPEKSMDLSLLVEPGTVTSSPSSMPASPDPQNLWASVWRKTFLALTSWPQSIRSTSKGTTGTSSRTFFFFSGESAGCLTLGGVARPVTNSILHCWLFIIYDHCTKTQSVSVALNMVLGPPQLTSLEFGKKDTRRGCGPLKSALLT